MRIIERGDEAFVSSTLTRETKAVVKFVDEPDCYDFQQLELTTAQLDVPDVSLSDEATSRRRENLTSELSTPRSYCARIVKSHFALRVDGRKTGESNRFPLLYTHKASPPIFLFGYLVTPIFVVKLSWTFNDMYICNNETFENQ